MISEKKIDTTVSVGNLLLQGFISTYRSNRSSNERGVLIYIRKDIPSNFLTID